MAFTIRAADEGDIKRLTCPVCGEKVKYVGVARDSKIHGLTFRCKKCHSLWAVETE